MKNEEQEVYSYLNEEDEKSLDYPVLKLSDKKEDWITTRDLIRHTLVFGSTGSGKTSGYGKIQLYNMLKAGFGGIVMTAKADEADYVKTLAKRAGRGAEDIIDFKLDGEYIFNFLDYTFKQGQARGKKTYIQDLVHLFKVITSLYSNTNNQDSKDSYWIHALDQLLGNSLRTLIYAGAELSLVEIHSFISTLPMNQEQWDDTAWQEKSLAFKRIAQAEKWITKTESKADVDAIEQSKINSWKTLTKLYWEHNFMILDPKTKATIIQMFTGMAEQLMSEGVREVFAEGDTNITPEDTFKGKVIILNIPYLDNQESARLCQVVFKYCWQKAVEKRGKTTDADRPVFLYADEAHYFTTVNDPAFLSTARSSKACVCYLTQNLNGLGQFLGHNQMNLEAFIDNFQIFVFHANSSHKTNAFASRLIGKIEMKKKTMSSSDSTHSDGTIQRRNSGHSESIRNEWDYQLHPIQFSQLAEGSARYDTKVECIIYMTGKKLWSNGLNYKWCVVEQKMSKKK